MHNRDDLRQQRQRLLVIILLALVLRLILLDAKSLWLDEAASWRKSLGPATVILNERSDPHPPAYYLFLHTWTYTGNSEFLLRLPSAVFGALTVLVLYGVGRTLNATKAGLLAAFLLAIDPIHIWYSQEVRMYAMVTFLTLTGVYFAVQLLRRGSWIDWLGCWLAFVNAAYFDYGGLIVWGLQIAVVIGLSGWLRTHGLSHFWKWLSAQVVVVMLYVPWAQNAARAFDFLLGGHVFKLIVEGAGRLGLAIETQAVTGAVIGAGLVALLLVVSGLQVIQRRNAGKSVPARLLQFTAWAMLGLYVMWLLAAAWPRLYSVKRQLVILIPYFLLAVAAALLYLNRRTMLYAAAAGAIAVTALNLMVWSKEDWRGAAKLIAAAGQSQDAIVGLPDWISIPFTYYYDRTTHPATYMTFNELKRAQPDRVWLVVGRTYEPSNDTSLRQELNQTREAIGHWNLYQVEVVLYQ